MGLLFQNQRYCNILFLDLFCLLTGVNNIQLKKNLLYNNIYRSKRNGFFEFKGSLVFISAKGHELVINDRINQLNKNGIRFKMIGSKKNLSKKLNKILLKSEKITKSNKNLQINLALNYGSKSELINAINLIKRKKINFSISNVNKHLYTANTPDPDILIRTGNTNRLSNFMLWQLAYSELYFLDKLWPDFNGSDLRKIIKKYRSTKRNFGKIYFANDKTREKANEISSDVRRHRRSQYTQFI